MIVCAVGCRGGRYAEGLNSSVNCFCPQHCRPWFSLPPHLYADHDPSQVGYCSRFECLVRRQKMSTPGGASIPCESLYPVRVTRLHGSRPRTQTGRPHCTVQVPQPVWPSALLRTSCGSGVGRGDHAQSGFTASSVTNGIKSQVCSRRCAMRNPAVRTNCSVSRFR